jgi:predicted peptidase
VPNIIEKNPGVFAAGVPISGGGFPDVSTVETLREVPLWFFHGVSDHVVSPDFSIHLANALEAAGGDVQLSLVPGSHNSGYQFAFRDEDKLFFPWLFSQSLPVPEPSTGMLIAFALVIPAFLRRVPARSTSVSTTLRIGR